MYTNNKFIKNYFKYIGENFKRELDLVHFITERALSILISEKSLLNFRNNELSYFSGSLVYPDKNTGVWFNRGIIRQYLGFLKDLYYFKKEIGNECKKLKIKFIDTKDDNIGNPIIYQLFNFSETGTNIYNNFLFSLINKYEHDVSFNSILEIGAGFGKLSSLFILKNKNIDYSIVEYPGTALIANYYLEKKFGKELDINLIYSLDQLENIYDVKNVNIFTFNYIKENIKIFKNIDTVINVQSFQHMNENNIIFYLNLFESNNINNIISINRLQPTRDGEVDFKEMFINRGYKIYDNNEIKDHYNLHNNSLFLTLFKRDR